MFKFIHVLLVKWSRRRPLTAESGVRLPYGLPTKKAFDLFRKLFSLSKLKGSRTPDSERVSGESISPD